MRTHSDSVLPTCVLTLLIVACVALACTRPHHAAERTPRQTARVAETGALRNGLYHVLWEAASADSANLVASGQVVLPYDRKYTGSTETEPRTYVAIDTASLVPLILEGQPEARQDETGRALLSVTLARRYAKDLEEFTTKHLGERAAVLLDGEVVTMHKVRSVIREGKLQITRCDGNTCQVLRARLAR
jgi:preprotein translocase subunit SecD